MPAMSSSLEQEQQLERSDSITRRPGAMRWRRAARSWEQRRRCDEDAPPNGRGFGRLLVETKRPRTKPLDLKEHQPGTEHWSTGV